MKRLHPIVRRLLLSCAVGFVIAFAISEGSYQLLRDNTDRNAEQIEIVVPEGTAEQVAAGNDVVPLPEEMVFVTGDVLVVKNEDVTDHQLGPVWVPPGATGSLVLDQANKFSYGCSFVPSRFLGLDVRSPGTSFQSRVLALAFVAPPTIVLIMVYGVLVVPLPKREHVVAVQAAPAQQASWIDVDAHLPQVVIRGENGNPPANGNGNGKTIH